MGFHHVGTEVFYNKESSNYTICGGSGEDPDCSNSVAKVDNILYLSEHGTYIKLDTSHPKCWRAARSS
jgi:hypothetical protein